MVVLGPVPGYDRICLMIVAHSFTGHKIGSNILVLRYRIISFVILLEEEGNDTDISKVKFGMAVVHEFVVTVELKVFDGQ